MLKIKCVIGDEYFDWLYTFFGPEEEVRGVPTYYNLLNQLASITFTWTMELDSSREEDAQQMRRDYMRDNYCEGYFEDLGNPPITVYEMMAALSIRCENQIMHSDEKGYRYGQWFWEMVVSLGLGQYTDSRYARRTTSAIREVDQIIYSFLNRDFAPTGEGGLFTVAKPRRDLRMVDIWYQAMWHFAEKREWELG